MAKRNDVSWIVYWLTDDRCVCPWRHGYIGCTNDITRKIWKHRESFRFPLGFKFEVLFIGNRSECFHVEQILRPKPHIGWNIGVGGYHDGQSLKGVPKSPEQREKMRQAALRRYEDPNEHKRTSRDVKKGLKDVDRSGTNNAMSGQHHSEETKQKIRDKLTNRGGYKGKNNPNYRHGRYC